jgi:riboflavin synthase
MFTGLVEEVGRVVERRGDAQGVRLVVRAPALAGLARTGDSVSVDGCCLTVTAVADGQLAFEAVPETLRRTALDRLEPGSAVNLEDALRAGEPLGGHIVQGHVDGVVEVREVAEEGIGRRLRVSLPAGLGRYVVEKGSIALQGVSLTVAELGEDELTVALIPQTCADTTLGALRVGDPVNVEVDVLAKHVERLLG